jgi:hypothetical protein
MHTTTKEAIIDLHEFVAPLYKKYAHRPVARQRIVDFNQGIDGRKITLENMKKPDEINIRPVRIAFDSWKEHRIYDRAVRAAATAGLTDLSNYMLYNYGEEPVDLSRRMKQSVDLCDELKITIFSFPMKYHPIDDPKWFRNRDFIGKRWSKKYIRAVQAVLTSTHGKIGRGKQFFEAAFGRDENEFTEILLMPEALIINRFEHDSMMRERYPKYSKPEYIGTTTNEWRAKFNSLTIEQHSAAIDIIEKNQFADSDIDVEDAAVKDILRYYQIQRPK